MWLVEETAALALRVEALLSTRQVRRETPETLAQTEPPGARVRLVIPAALATPALLVPTATPEQPVPTELEQRQAQRVTPEAQPRQPTLMRPL